MVTHWDESDLSAKTAEYRVYPDAISSELDRWLPPTASGEVRSGANFLVGLASGLLDSFYLSFASSIASAPVRFRVPALEPPRDQYGAYRRASRWRRRAHRPGGHAPDQISLVKIGRAHV